jgi:hypothetical protein
LSVLCRPQAGWGAKVYLHAFSHLRVSDEPDYQEEDEFRRLILEAAGVAPKAPEEFILRVTKALGGYLAENKYDSVQLANMLNVDCIPNAKGARWNQMQVQKFAAKYLKSKRLRS